MFSIMAGLLALAAAQNSTEQDVTVTVTSGVETVYSCGQADNATVTAVEWVTESGCPIVNATATTNGTVGTAAGTAGAAGAAGSSSVATGAANAAGLCLSVVLVGAAALLI